MSNQPIDSDDMPAEIDFSNGVRGLHHIPMGAKAELRGVPLSGLVTEVLKRDIEINEALK